MAPEIEQVEEEAPTVAEEPVEMNGGNGDDAEARRAERRRQQRAKRKHGRR
jgi:hypothetical protein